MTFIQDFQTACEEKQKHYNQHYIGRNRRIEFSIQIDVLGTQRWPFTSGEGLTVSA